MKINKPPIKKSVFLNVSIFRDVVSATGNMLDALIIDLIYYRYRKYDKKPVWLKIDWINDALPYISRAGLAKRLKKLAEDGHIIIKKGEGRLYHKCYYSPSPDMIEACRGEGEDGAKVYYNQTVAKRNLDASVVYAAIISLLKQQVDAFQNVKGIKYTSGATDRIEDKVLLNYELLAEGSGLTLHKVRKAVRWLITNKILDEKKVFGNKRFVSLPADSPIKLTDLKLMHYIELPTECFPHEEDLTEY